MAIEINDELSLDNLHEVVDFHYKLKRCFACKGTGETFLGYECLSCSGTGKLTRGGAQIYERAALREKLK